MVRRSFQVCILALCCSALPGSAVADIINVDSAQNCPEGNGLEVFMTAGSYVVTQIDMGQGGQYTAWNAWGGQVSGCDKDGGNCSQGWLTVYGIVAPDVPVDTYGGGIWETADLAFENEAENTSFTLMSDQSVTFFVPDSSCTDNIGGVSLDVTEAVPTLPRWAFLLLGAILILVAYRVLSRQAIAS